MKKKRWVLGMFCLLFLLTGSAGAGDIQELIKETQKMHQSQDSVQIVWWMPDEYWQKAFENSPGLTEEQKKIFCNAVNDYIVLGIVDAKMSSFGGIIPMNKETIMKKITVTIGDQLTLTPLPDQSVSADAKNLFSMMKPVLENMLGQVGKGFAFICFNGKNKKGEQFIDPKKDGSFTVVLGDQSYKWRLPLGSLLPPRFDPKTGEQFPGNYKYSPFTGSSLTTSKPTLKGR